MSDQNITPIKGFRQAPKPTKGEVLRENATLGQQLTQQMMQLQQFFGNLINQLMRQSKTHDQELSSLSQWIAASETSEPAQKGDHMVLDYAGVLLNEDGSDATLKFKDGEGNDKEIPDLFDGGNGKLFMLTNLVGGTLIPGFEEQLVGLKAGEGKVIEVQFPKEYGVESLKDKKVRFTVFVHVVKRPFPNSPVGLMVDENSRIRNDLRTRAIAEAQAAVKKAQEEAKAAQPAETPAEPAQAETQAQTSDTSTGAEQTTEQPKG